MGSYCLSEVEKMKKSLMDEFKIHQRIIRSTTVELQTSLKRKAIEMVNKLELLYKEKCQHLDELSSQLTSYASVPNTLSDDLIRTLFGRFQLDVSMCRKAIEGLNISALPTFDGHKVSLPAPQFTVDAELEVIVTGGITRTGIFWLRQAGVSESVRLGLAELPKYISFEKLTNGDWNSYKDSGTSPQIGENVLVDSQYGWVRGKVEKLRDDNTFSVRLLDFGDLISCAVDELFPVKGNICVDCKYQAVACCLALDPDPFDLPIEAVWAFNDALRENKVLQEPVICKFKSKIYGKNKEEICKVDLLVKNKNGERVSLGNVVRQKVNDKSKGRAVIACRDIRYSAKECTDSLQFERLKDENIKHEQPQQLSLNEGGDERPVDSGNKEQLATTSSSGTIPLLRQEELLPVTTNLRTSLGAVSSGHQHSPIAPTSQALSQSQSASLPNKHDVQDGIDELLVKGVQHPQLGDATKLKAACIFNDKGESWPHPVYPDMLAQLPSRSGGHITIPRPQSALEGQADASSGMTFISQNQQLMHPFLLQQLAAGDSLEKWPFPAEVGEHCMFPQPSLRANIRMEEAKENLASSAWRSDLKPDAPQFVSSRCIIGNMPEPPASVVYTGNYYDQRFYQPANCPVYPQPSMIGVQPYMHPAFRLPAHFADHMRHSEFIQSIPSLMGHMMYPTMGSTSSHITPLVNSNVAHMSQPAQLDSFMLDRAKSNVAHMLQPSQLDSFMLDQAKSNVAHMSQPSQLDSFMLDRAKSNVAHMSQPSQLDSFMLDRAKSNVAHMSQPSQLDSFMLDRAKSNVAHMSQPSQPDSFMLDRAKSNVAHMSQPSQLESFVSDAANGDAKSEDAKPQTADVSAVETVLGDTFIGQVTTSIEEDGIFWMQMAKETLEKVAEWNSLQGAMSTFNNVTLHLRAEEVLPGMAVLVPDTRGRELLRAEVLAVKDRKATIRCFDSGITLYVPRDSLKNLGEKFLYQPRHAVQCRLFNLTSGNAKLDDVVRERFSILVKGKTLEATVKSVENGMSTVVNVELHDIDGSNIGEECKTPACDDEKTKHASGEPKFSGMPRDVGIVSLAPVTSSLNQDLSSQNTEGSGELNRPLMTDVPVSLTEPCRTTPEHLTSSGFPNRGNMLFDPHRAPPLHRSYPQIENSIKITTVCPPLSASEEQDSHLNPNSNRMSEQKQLACESGNSGRTHSKHHQRQQQQQHRKSERPTDVPQNITSDARHEMQSNAYAETNCPDRNRWQTDDGRKGKGCFNCGELGHVMKFCNRRPQKNRREQQQRAKKNT